MSDIALPTEINGIEVEFMVYKLCDGDITRKKWIEENLDIGDFVEFMSFKKYDNFIKAEYNSRYQELHNDN